MKVLCSCYQPGLCQNGLSQQKRTLLTKDCGLNDRCQDTLSMCVFLSRNSGSQVASHKVLCFRPRHRTTVTQVPRIYEAQTHTLCTNLARKGRVLIKSRPLPSKFLKGDGSKLTSTSISISRGLASHTHCRLF